jgi:hypothetical protein
LGGNTGRGRARGTRWAQAAGLAAGLLGFAAIATTGSGLPAGKAAVTEPAGTTAQTDGATSPPTSAAQVGTPGPLREQRLTGPDRIIVRDDVGPVATFTVGSRSVTLRGPQRRFSESTTTASVTTTTWVRLLPQPFSGTVDHGWLTARLGDTSDDVLEVARQYLTGAADLGDASGRRIAGDASYGPLLADGTREEGSDFNDFLGVAWSYGTSVDRPETRQYGAMDCSGYIRAVFAHRMGVPVTLDPDGASLPRRAVQMADSAPGVTVIPNAGLRPESLAALQPGDLVFFDASADDGALIDHVGIHLGTDSSGAPRFLSSRKGADGPTMGDIRGRSTLSGSGLYATSFRSARRL